MRRRVGGPALLDGPYAAAWWDTLQGKVFHSAPVIVEDGAAVLELPRFRVDVALRMLASARTES